MNGYPIITNDVLKVFYPQFYNWDGNCPHEDHRYDPNQIN